MSQEKKKQAFVIEDPEETQEAPPEDDTTLPPEAPPPPRLPTGGEGDVPEWVLVPQNLKVPRGRSVIFLRFPAELTGNTQRGERQCICWTLSDGEEKMANDRSQGNSARAVAEYTKQMIRAVDGAVVDWAKPRGPGSIDEFYREVGPKGRNLLMRIYTQLHIATDDETRAFFENCVAVRTAG